MSAHDLLFNMADTACVRAWEDEMWGPIHRKLLTTCVKIEKPGRRKSVKTLETTVLNHLKKTGSLSIREAMDDYGMSGGTITKTMTNLRRNGHSIRTVMKKHPISGRRYARYYYAA